MSAAEDEFQALKETLRTIEGCFETEHWKDDHDVAMRCRDLEEKFVATLPVLDKLAGAIEEMAIALAGGRALNVSELYKLRILCTGFSEIHDHVLGRLRDIGQDEYRVDLADEIQARLREVRDVLEPIGRTLEEAKFRLADSMAGQSAPFDPPLIRTRTRVKRLLGLARRPRRLPSRRRPRSTCVKNHLGLASLPDPPPMPAEQTVPFDLPRPGTWKHVEARPGLVRLPDPPFLTEEQPAPFDLPLFGTRVRVKARPGPVRLPDPIDD